MVKEILEPVGKMDGDSLPVSAFAEHVDGQFELGASAYEKRGVAVSVPTWDANKCIQCNQCAWRGMRGTTACCTKRSISATHRGRSPTRTSPVCAA